MKKRVVILGGGVAGMTAAHELIQRGFEVTVFELHPHLGGKARSFALHHPKHSEPASHPPSPSRRKIETEGKFGNPEKLYKTAGGRRPLPGEHGFRFFPGFYKHLPDTMKNIPFGKQANGVFDNLVEAPRFEAACLDLPPISMPTHFPTSPSDLRAALIGWREVYSRIPASELAYFFGRMMLLASSCDRRRLEEYEQIGWWDFIGASDRSTTYQRYLALAATRPLVACRAEEVSARTGGLIALRLFFDMSRPGLRVDRVLNGPTNETWIRPWFEYLRDLGVTFRRGAKVEAIHCRDRRITGVRVSYRDINNPAHSAKSSPKSEIVSADYYVAAIPVEAIRTLLTDELCEAEPGLYRLHELKVAWMNGVQFYLKHDVPIIAGHIIYLDSPWALTSISQQQFWRENIAENYGNGRVAGILSVDVSNWDAPGILYGRPASECSRQEIREEIWAQLKSHLNQGGAKLLDDNNLVGVGIDRDVREHVCPGQSEHTRDCLNREPLLINTVGSWNSRPDVETGISNFFLASDYVRTTTDLATMEGANEAARRAVNAILDASGSSRSKCQLWPSHEPTIFAPLRALDRVVYQTGQTHLLNKSLAALLRDGTNLVDRLAGRLRSQEGVTVKAAIDEKRLIGPPVLSRSDVYTTARIGPQNDSARAQRRGKIRVAILGGGMSAITTAFKLTETEELRQKYDVTIYQIGWRIGGKGASGRNPHQYHRIEEHGLHLWFGFYDNAFKIMRQCYEDLGRDASMPLASVEDAFKPCDNLIVYERYNDQWSGWEFKFPRNSLPLGDQSQPVQFWHIAYTALTWLRDHWHAFEAAERVRQTDVDSLIQNDSSQQPFFYRIVEAIRSEVDDLAAGFQLLERALSVAVPRKLGRSSNRSSDQDRSAMLAMLAQFKSWLWRRVAGNLSDQESRRFFQMVDYVVTALTGIISDRLLERGFDGVNDETLLQWYQRHGAYPVTLNGPLVRFTYYAAFAFREGNPLKPDCAAGVALSAMLRMLFTYKTAITFKMQAGMGDTVFAPLYLVLKKRGVKFKFFHAVKKLALSDDKRSISSIEVIPQADLRNGKYDPLISVRGLKCWPNQPRWEQLNQGSDLKSQGVNFEHQQNPLKKKHIILRNGNDFDLVVLGIPVAALAEICGELVKDDGNPDFKKMIEHSSTIMTQAFQVWVKRRATDGLGWNFEENSIMTGYSDPFDTYSDMSQLICREQWFDGDPRNPMRDTAPVSDEETPRSVAYFCSALEDKPGDNQAKAEQRAKNNALHYLRRQSAAIWPNAMQSEQRLIINWDLLVAPDNAHGEERFNSQFWIANYQPSERYVLTPAGSPKFRLRTDQSGYDNLYLTGDWIDNGGLNVGSIEAAVMAGMQTARHIKGTSDTIAGENTGTHAEIRCQRVRGVE